MTTLTEQDARARAEAEVRAFCGWHIAPEQTDELTVDGSGACVQPLPTLRLNTLDALVVDGDAADLGGVEWSQAGFLRRAAAFPDGLRSVTATISHGYAAMPLDVQAVIDRLVERGVETIGALVQVGQVRYATGSDGLPAAATLTDLDRAVLDRYRLPPRP